MQQIEQTFQGYLYECEFIKKLRPATLKGYKNVWETFMQVAQISSFADISPSVTVSFFKTLNERQRIVGRGQIKVGIKKSTVASYWCKLNGFFAWLVIRNYIPENPLAGLKYPTPSYDDKKYLRKDEIEKILAAIYKQQDRDLLLFKRNTLLFELLLYCGLRKEELLNLKMFDIDLKTKTISIRPENSKSGNLRQIPLRATTILRVKDYLVERKQYKTEFLVVSHTHDHKLSSDGLRHVVQKIKQASGIHFHLHQFRHTFAVNFLKTTNNIFKLKLLLGHKDIRVTALYLRCLPPDEMREDVEQMNISDFL